MGRANYEHSLEDLRMEIAKMGSLAEKAIEDSVKAFKTGDMDLCWEIIGNDKAVDDLEKSIESMCLWLIAREQPVASDLRKITTALKMITDIERIGDNASDIAELTLRIARKNTFSDSGHLPRMAAAAVAMVHDAVTASMSTDLELARATEKKDDEVDDYFNLIKNDLRRVFAEDGEGLDNAIDLLLIAKYLERIADHAVNICEWVEFSATGEHKHAKIF
jgi:phosphate transport system protein